MATAFASCALHAVERGDEATLDKCRKDLDILEEKAAADEKELVERMSRIAGKPVKLETSLEK